MLSPLNCENLEKKTKYVVSDAISIMSSWLCVSNVTLHDTELFLRTFSMRFIDSGKEVAIPQCGVYTKSGLFVVTYTSQMSV